MAKHYECHKERQNVRYEEAEVFEVKDLISIQFTPSQYPKK
jgi:hypothetical protein